MLFVLLSKRFLHMTVLDGFAFVAIHANLLDRYKFTHFFCVVNGLTIFFMKIHKKQIRKPPRAKNYGAVRPSPALPAFVKAVGTKV